MQVKKLTDVFGVEPKQTLNSLIQDLIAYHRDHDLRNFE